MHVSNQNMSLLCIYKMNSQFFAATDNSFKYSLYIYNRSSIKQMQVLS